MADPFEKYRPKREQLWPEVECFFRNLPPHLFRQGRLLKNHLAARYSDSGQFKDILCRRHDYPALYLGFWLLDDFDFPAGEARDRIEKHLFPEMLLSFSTIYVNENILDEGSFFDNDYVFLAHALRQGASTHLAQLFPAESAFWEHYQAFWNDYAEAVLWEAQEGEQELPPTAEKYAPMKTSAAAVAIQAGREASLPELLSLMDHLNTVLQIGRDVSAVRRDLMRGDCTYPIARTMMEAGLPLRGPVAPEQVMGAMILTGSIREIAQECLGHLDACRAIAGELGLPTFQAYFTLVEQLMDEMLGLFSLRPKPVPTKGDTSREKKGGGPGFVPYVDTASRAIEMAEGYLLSDLTFRESWEVHRRGMFDAPEVVSKFPSGLIIEILCRHGHDMSQQIDRFYEDLQNSRFSYYDHPAFPYPDTDNLGVLLRLYRYSAHKDLHRAVLETPLGWMVDNVRDSGQIPVWLTKHVEPDHQDVPPMVLLGEDCGTIEANLLLGLIDYAREDYHEVIENSALNLLDRFIKTGLSISVNYPPLYALGAMAELISRLSGIDPPQLGSPSGELFVRPVQEALRGKIKEASKVLAEHLEIAIQRRRLSPQDAALLALACANPLVEGLFNPRWNTIMFKHQRSDGSWGGEPLFFVPNRGEVVTWYSSNTLTTAFCYHALKTCAQVQNE